jgi:RND family efflux transporter MFP subunit
MKKAIRIILTLAIIAGVLALIAYVLKKNKKENEARTAVVAEQGNSAIAVRIDTVKREALELGFGSNGTFIPKQELKFSAEKPGRVTRVLVDEGDRVSIGQVLATIRTDQLSVDVQNAKANYDNALKDKERYENAFKTGGVTQQQLDQARLALQNAKSKLDLAGISLGDANIRATISGIVNKRFIEPGAVVAAGGQLFELVNVSSLKLAVTVNEAQVASLKIGDKIKVTASVFPGKEFSGRVTFISPKADNSLNFPVEIEVANNKDNDLKAGMFGTAIFDFPQQAPLVTVARTAFVGSVSSNQVFVVGKDSTAMLRKVTAGRVIGDKVEIIDGLKEGEIAIVSGQVNLADGAKINIIQ